MSQTEAFRENANESISVKSSPRPLTPMSSHASVVRRTRNANKPMPTITMIKHALKALSSANSRKGFSLAGIRKYILQHYLATETELKPRLHYIKTFVRSALDSGELSNFKGTGLNGSFRVSSKSSLLGKSKSLKAKSNKVKKERQRKTTTTTKRGKQVKRQHKTKIPIKKRTTKYSVAY